MAAIVRLLLFIVHFPERQPSGRSRVRCSCEAQCFLYPRRAPRSAGKRQGRERYALTGRSSPASQFGSVVDAVVAKSAIWFSRRFFISRVYCQSASGRGSTRELIAAFISFVSAVTANPFERDPVAITKIQHLGPEIGIEGSLPFAILILTLPAMFTPP